MIANGGSKNSVCQHYIDESERKSNTVLSKTTIRMFAFTNIYIAFHAVIFSFVYDYS